MSANRVYARGRPPQVTAHERRAGRSMVDTEPVLVRLRGPDELASHAPSAAPRRFHTSLPGYAPTPVRPATEAARRLGVAQVLVKDESARLGLPSFKLLGLELKDVDLLELNEAFAAQSLAAIRELGLEPERINPHGGAIALGHPIGASGGRILVTLLHK